MRRWIPWAAALTLLGACGGPTSPADGPAGAYHLRSVDGQRVPYRIVDRPGVEILDRRVVLEPVGSFSDVLSFRVQVGQETVVLPRIRTGTYAGAPPGITLTLDSGREMRAAVAGGILVLDDRGVIFRLAR